MCHKKLEKENFIEMAEGATSLKELRAQMAASAQAQAEERRSLAGNSPVPASPATANTPPSTTAAKSPRPVIDGAALRIDDRLRVAKERREEADRQQAAKDSQILERERKAKLQVERQMEERQKKLDEQRRKEEQRRSAVEEKRKQKQEEEKEHYEAVMRRTLERSQRVEQRQKRWSWGGLSESDNRSGDPDAGAASPVAIVISPASPEKPPRTQQSAVDKRSTSTMNLKQLSEASINKRLSSSSATLINSPDKSARVRSSSLNRLPRNDKIDLYTQPNKEGRKKLQVEQTGPSLKKRSSSLTRAGGGKTQTPSKLDKGTTDDQARKPLASPVDGGFLSRLLTPTQASLARSKSAAALSAEGGDAPASASPLHPVQRGPLRSRSIDRQKSATLPTSASADQVDPSLKEKRFSSPGGKRPASPSNIAGRHRSPSPAPLPASKRTPSPSAKPSPRNRPSSPGGIKHRPSSPQFSSAKPPSPQPTSAKPPPIQRPALTPTGPPTLRKRDSKPKDLCPIQPVVPQSSEAPQASTTPTPTHTTSSKTKDKDDKSMAGTNSAAEAAMILAENRRLAREKKEREEALRVLREEEEKLRKEEDKRLAEEDRLKRLEEEKRLAEERKKKEEEDALMAEADRERLEVEEAVRQAELQKEREEAEAQAAIEAEKVRIERERVMAQNQQERMERKKRIEEIMKRTRKGDLEKRDYDEGDEEGDEEEAKDDESAQTGDVAMETDCMDEGRGLTRSEPMGERREPLGSVNWKPEADDKENNNGTSAEEPLAVNPVPKGRLVEGSEFLNEDSNKLAPGLNGKPGPWSFEELIDLGVNSKGRPLIDAEGRNQGLIDCDGGPEGPRVAFEDKGIPVATLHPSSQPIEALSEM
ncbi:MAP7 domain-containing protein 2 isoform X2 [Oncorhynchus tshawytscha]|uniref:MAP7 domain-containing protein 2 isoform X2 n=1 Tax=Oncorhynchus tshawytscha TaxID=74940 RepID=UPI001C3D702B|nr:MAP7 domain-containing protein 2 isoform X2 [Oncorhynchus tshawytscha]